MSMDQDTRDRILLENSIERVFNTAISVLMSAQFDPRHASRNECLQMWDEDRDQVSQDLRALKSTTVWIWNEARNAAFVRAQKGAGALPADTGSLDVIRRRLEVQDERIRNLQERLEALMASWDAVHPEAPVEPHEAPVKGVDY